MVVLGAGSVARAAVYAGVMSGAHVTVLDNDEDCAQKIAKDFSCEYGTLAEYRRSSYDIVIHTTSIGMKGEECILGEDTRFHEHQVVFDCVYSPLDTPLILAAKEAGAEVITGDKMFLAQVSEQFRFFTGKEAPKEVFEKELADILAEGVEYTQ
jgi:shikimate 5-dehydrogenase